MPKSIHFLAKDVTFTQNLAAGALSHTTTFSQARKLEQVLIHASQAISETISIKIDSKNGANYDTVLQEVVLVAETDFVYRPQGECNIQSGDELVITCTNANGVGIVYGTIKTSEM